jgi:hypothetical protein
LKSKGSNNINIQKRRLKLISLLGSGLSLYEIANKLNCSIDTIYKDKEYISKEGLNQLRDLGNTELCFYFSTIINDLNNVKLFLWSILKTDKGKNGTQSDITTKDKIYASKTIIDLDNSLRETYKDSIASILIDDYKKRLEHLESILSLENTNDITEDNKPINYMTLNLPKLKEQNNKVEP